METKTRKTTMIGAALAVAIIALAGAGYATQYHAQTTSSDNTMNATYMTVTQDGHGTYATDSFLTDLYFDSENVSSTVTNYRPVLTHDASYGTTGTKTLALISVSDFELNVEQTGTPVTTAQLDIAATSGFTYNSKLLYTMVVTSDGGATLATYSATDVSASDSTWTFSSVALKNGVGESNVTTLTVRLFVSLLDTSAPLNASEAVSGFAATGTTGEKTTFEFKLTAGTA